MQRDAGVMSGQTGTRTATRTPAVAELEQWPVLPCPPRPIGRDVALDLLRGLAMIILVVNHTRLSSWLGVATGTLVSAAEVLVPVSGVAVGMVFGRRWLANGAWATTLQLWRRARTLYLASVTVGVLVGVATVVPGLAVDAATVSSGGKELYAFDGPVRTVLAVLTLEAGPWQINVLGLFVVTLLLAPAVLWALDRGWWHGLLIGSAALYLLGRALDVDVLPTQSEGPFPVLVWQVLFVPGVVVGFHRRRVSDLVRRAPRAFGVAAAVVAGAAVALQVGLAPSGVRDWRADHFDKAGLDPLRLLVMVSLGGALYLLMRRYQRSVERRAGWLLLPLGRNSLYVFLVHVPLCVLLASVPILRNGGLGPIVNSLVLVGCVSLLALMVRREVLFRWIPR